MNKRRGVADPAHHRGNCRILDSRSIDSRTGAGSPDAATQALTLGQLALDRCSTGPWASSCVGIAAKRSRPIMAASTPLFGAEASS